jgi:hypothetical protein
MSGSRLAMPGTAVTALATVPLAGASAGSPAHHDAAGGELP